MYKTIQIKIKSAFTLTLQKMAEVAYMLIRADLIMIVCIAIPE